MEDGLGGEAVRGFSDLWSVLCRLWRVGDEGDGKEGVVDRLFDGEDFGLDVLERDPECCLPYVTSYDGVLRTHDMTRCGNLPLYDPSGGS